MICTICFSLNKNGLLPPDDLTVRIINVDQFFTFTEQYIVDAFFFFKNKCKQKLLLQFRLLTVWAHPLIAWTEKKNRNSCNTLQRLLRRSKTR
jgi:hypothetical protein